MNAADIMTTSVITVGPDTGVREIAELLLAKRISAVPVIDDEQRVLGIVSEGDLMRRLESDSEERHSWWIENLFSQSHDAEHYIKAHGRTASEVMTRDVITVSVDMPLHEIATTLERNHIKRVPVTDNNRLVGIVSRANLLHGLTAGPVPEQTRSVDDRTIRDSLMHELSEEVGLVSGRINVTVHDGVVQLWGIVYSEKEKQAAELAAVNTPGVRSVENFLGSIPPWLAEA
ncbi:CBS domain-containing protein [Pontibacterium granulatum]|uniref:CBS domain-containing protein n=1 Tax=Pontibacterium granulatum TaxID=2036029 RepID=UPI00249B701A|nr:CBS domain-containing protein [Pontibacterium granulatum]MDI3323412.1 CBS domain-containing protein [Pontibacterium granulatum]